MIMPNIIKKVLANVVQVLTETEKQRARGNIDAASKDNISYWHQVENFDTQVSSTDNAKSITSVGNIRLLYYFDSEAKLRIAVENNGPRIDTLEVIYFGGSQTLTSLATESRVATSAIFNNGNGQFQHLRLIVDDSEIYDVYIQMSIAMTALFYKCPDILYRG
jgi:hypothetical protein